MASKKRKKRAGGLLNIKKGKNSNLAKIPFLKLIYTAVALDILTIAFVFLFQNRIPPVIPLFYGLAEGEGQLASSTQLTLPVFASLAIVIINTSIALFLKNEFLRQILVLTGIIVALFSTITVFKIVFLVGNF